MILFVQRAIGKSNLPYKLRVLNDGEKVVTYLATLSENQDKANAFRV